MADVQILAAGSESLPWSYTVPNTQEVVPKAVSAIFDGTSATAPFVAMLEIVSDGGIVVAQSPSATIAAAGSAEVSWFQGAEVEEEAAGQTAGVTVESLFLDSTASSVTSSTVLVSGTPYVLIVQGTFSLWNSALNDGTPNANAMFPGSTAGRVSTQVGNDPDVQFAAFNETGSWPRHATNFQVNLGSGFSHIEPDGGPYATPQTNYLYRYSVTGQGSAVSFRVLDSPISDNYGKLQITIQGTSGGSSGGGGGGSLLPPASVTNGLLRSVSGVPTWESQPALTDSDLSTTGVTAATYGDSSHVAQVAINAEGRVTSAANVAVSGGAPSGPAGGDLGGTYPNPSVVAVTETGGPTDLVLGAIPDGDFLKRSGASIIGASGGAGTISDITSTGGTITVSSPTGPTTNLELPATGVTGGSYGDSSHVGSFTVDAEGRLTAASSVSITGGGAVAGADGWVTDTNSYTYASGSGGGIATFTVGASDLTAVYSPGTLIKLTQTTVKYFVVQSSSFGGGTTTVTITAGSDYTLANAAISSPFYSYVATPQGYPGWFNFAAAAAGFSVKTSDVGMFSVTGRLVTIKPAIVGTSNIGTFTFTLPITPPNTALSVVPVTNNGGTVLGRAVVTGGSTSCAMGASVGATGGFVNSGTKGCTSNMGIFFDL